MWTFYGIIDGYDGYDEELDGSRNWYLCGVGNDDAYIHVEVPNATVLERIRDCFMHQDDFEGIKFEFKGHFGSCEHCDLVLDSIEEV